MYGSAGEAMKRRGVAAPLTNRANYKPAQTFKIDKKQKENTNENRN